MFTPDIHLLSDPWAPHPVANRHICSGGGGDGGGAAPSPDVPDYSQYIKAMTDIGNQGVGWAKDLFGWAQKQGLNLEQIASRLSGRAEDAGARQEQKSQELMDQWQKNTGDLYGYMSEDARRMIRDLPTTEEQYGGRWGADAATSIDQQLAAEQRKQDALGISPGIASQALDTQARVGRATATTAAAEMGRRAARDEARGVTSGAIQTNQFLPGVAGQQAGLATANRTQAAQLPMGAAQTSAGLYNPSLGYYQAANPYMKAWGDTMSKSYDQQLARYKYQNDANAQAQESDEGGIMGAIAPIAGAAIGSIVPGVGTALGGMIGGALGQVGSKVAKVRTGGKIPKNGGRRIPRPGVPRFANGGAIDLEPPMEAGGAWMMQGGGAPEEGNYIPPEASPSGGGQEDDVHAMVSAGEFVIPERTVDWYGEKFFQNLIAKADNEAHEETVAEPEEAQMDGQQMAAMDTMPPMFRSEGARV